MLVIRNDEFIKYKTLLESNEEIYQRRGLQDIFWELAAGKYLLKSNQMELLTLLESLTGSTSYKIRKWVYHLTCFICNSDIEKKIIENFENENQENKSWIVATLSSTSTTDDFFSKLKKLNYDFSANQLSLMTYLFSKEPIWNLNSLDSVMNSNDKISHIWLTLNANYLGIAKKNKKSLEIFDKNNKAIKDIIFHGDQDINELGITCLWKFRNITMKDLSFNLYDYQNIPKDILKWYLAIMLSDKSFIDKHFDFIEELLDKEIFSMPLNVKEGVLLGLEKNPNTKSLSKFLIKWYFEEPEKTIITFLMNYFLQYKDDNEDYFEIIQDEIQSDNNIIKPFQLFLERRSKAMNINTFGGNNQINLAGGNNQINVGNENFKGFNIDDIEKIKKLIQTEDFSNKQTKEDICEKINEITEKFSIKNDKNYEEISDKIKLLSDEKRNFKDILVDIIGKSADIVTLATASPVIIQFCNELIKVISIAMQK